MIMTSIQISIRRDIYDKLKSLKGSGESFSDAIERLMNGQGNLQEVIKCYGIARGEHEDEIHEAYREAQAEVREQFKSRILINDDGEEQ
jgi:predicted CopG family antitoxin